MCDAYNRWLGDVLAGQERLKWVGVAILGTAGDRLLDDDSLLPFYEAVATDDFPSPSMSAGPVRRSIISTRISILPA